MPGAMGNMWDFSDIFRTPSGPHDAEQSECRTGLGLSLFSSVFARIYGRAPHGLGVVEDAVEDGAGQGVLYGRCFAFLTLCIKHLDASAAYAIWSGLGTDAIATIGVLWFKEPLTALRIVGLILVLAGVAALQLSNPAH